METETGTKQRQGVATEWLPPGQQVLRLGYRVVTESDIHEMLKLRKLCQKYWEMPRGKGNGMCRDREKTIAGCEASTTCSDWRRYLRRQPLAEYMEDVIPVPAMADIRTARAAGLTGFEVWWAHVDPIVTARLGKRLLLITQWS